jgi:hypothetical protein
MSAPWQPISLAPADEIVETKIHDDAGERNVQCLIREGNLWFFPDRSMYVYYRPTHWRRASEAVKRIQKEREDKIIAEADAIKARRAADHQ